MNNGLIAWLWGRFLTHNHTGGNNGAVLYGAVPAGTVMIWPGSAASVPTGWAIASEFAGRFARGGNSGNHGSFGGSDTYDTTHTHTPGSLATDGAGSHQHAFTAGAYASNINHGSGGESINNAVLASHTHVGTTPAGGGGAHSILNSTGASGGSTSHLPPYVSYYYIYKL